MNLIILLTGGNYWGNCKKQSIKITLSHCISIIYIYSNRFESPNQLYDCPSLHFISFGHHPPTLLISLLFQLFHTYSQQFTTIHPSTHNSSQPITHIAKHLQQLPSHGAHHLHLMASIVNLAHYY